MTTLKFELEQGEADVVLAGLGELPAKVSYDLINKMKQQATPQLVTDGQEHRPVQQTLLTEG